MIKFMIRVDDFPRALKTDPRIPDSTKHIRLAMFNEVFKKAGVKYILGVVPTLLDTKDIQLIREAKIDVAMHGVDHRANFSNLCKCDMNAINEDPIMHAVKKSCKLHKLLSEHKRIMEYSFGKITSYISPFNEDTPRLRYHLAQLGFKTFFGGEVESKGKCFFDDFGLMNLQSPRVYYARAREIPALVFNELVYRDDMAFRTIDDDILMTITLHFVWETVENSYGTGLQRLCEMLKGHETMWASDLEVYCK